jgi:hypothetical protein
MGLNITWGDDLGGTFTCLGMQWLVTLWLEPRADVEDMLDLVRR